ncbi:MAG: patatin-like phospholipase family protein [Polyangiales bacterium]
MRAPPTLRAWLREGPFTLTMSSGFFGFFAHTGALSALRDAGFAPTAVTGSSAGALVTGLYAAGLEVDALRHRLGTLRREEFWDPAPGAGLLRGARFRELLEALLPVRELTRCRVPFAPSVFDLRALRTVALREGDVASAIHASCAIPLLFQPVWIRGRPYADGGIADRPGLLGAPAEGRVLFHHLASRSPWRRPGSPSLRVPSRAGMVTVATEGVTRVHPFALRRGEIALAQAERAMREALDAALTTPVLRPLAR